MISCANKILSRSNNILSRRYKSKNKTRMSLPGFRRNLILQCTLSMHIVDFQLPDTHTESENSLFKLRFKQSVIYP